MNKIKLGLIPVLLVTLFLGITSCEQEDKFVGSSVVGSNAANLFKTYVDITAKTLEPDSIRADRSVMVNTTIGAFDENTFGKTKSYFYSQVRLGQINPTFGGNPVVDSVVLSIPVFGKTGSAGDTISTSHHLIKTIYNLTTDEENGCSVKDTLKHYETKYLFEMDSLYGNRSSNMALQVHRVTESLGTISEPKFSNKDISVGELFGSMDINSQVYKRSVSQIKNSGTDSTSISSDASPVIRMHLDPMKNFVQTNIVDQEGSTNLGDQISFINNVLQGIRIGVADDNGFLFNVNPSQLKLNAYISYDNEAFVDENGDGIDDDEEGCDVVSTTPRIVKNLSFDIGSNLGASGNQLYNVVQSGIINENGTIPYNQENLPTNYVEGMGGAKTLVSFDAEQISAIRDSIVNKGWIVTEARLKVYPDTSVQGSLDLPKYLYVYNHTDGTILDDYGSAETFTNDNQNIQAFPYVQISRPYGDDDNDYYLLRVTEFIKNIVEENQEIDDLAIEMGSYLGYAATSYFYAPPTAYYSNRIYNPYRLAIVGTNPNEGNSDKKLQLEIFYNKRKNN